MITTFSAGGRLGLFQCCLCFLLRLVEGISSFCQRNTFPKESTMSLGTITGFSEVVEWTIPDFFSLDKDKDEYVDSPRFKIAGHTWYLRMYPKGCKSDGHVAISFTMGDTDVIRTAKFSIGIKTKNGIEQELTSSTRKFEKVSTSWGWSDPWSLDDLQKRKSVLAPSDTLTIICRVFQEAPTPEEAGPSPTPASRANSQRTTFEELEGLSSDFKGLLISENACDFTINVQGKEFRTHRSVLAARSHVFRAMLEHNTAEAKTGVLKIPDCHPESFGEFLSFLYAGKIEDLSFETVYHLYSTAEKYDVQQLKSFCSDYLTRNLTAETVCKVVILSDQFSDHQLESSAQYFFNKNSLQIFLTADWSAMLRDSPHLVEKLTKEMANAGLKNS